MKIKFTNILTACLLAAISFNGSAEDIDLYSLSNGVTKPNVLIVLDNSSNWGATMTGMSTSDKNTYCIDSSTWDTNFCVQIAALQKVIADLNSNTRVGLMMFNETDNNGAYVRFAIRDMTDNNKAALIDLIKHLNRTGTSTTKDDSGSNQPYGKTMFEAFKYFGGYTNPAGANTSTAGSPVSNVGFGTTVFAGAESSGSRRRDYAGNTSPSTIRSAVSYGAENSDTATNHNWSAFSSSASTTYHSPIYDACAKNYILFISNGNPSTGGDSSNNPTAISSVLSTIGWNASSTTVSTYGTHPSNADELAAFMYQTDVINQNTVNGSTVTLTGIQNVMTHAMAVYVPDATKNCSGVSSTLSSMHGAGTSDCSMIQLMKNMASAGGGNYYDGTSASSVQTGFEAFFHQVNATNSVFVSSSLPVSVNTQGSYLNQVYMGMFRPDASAYPRWRGNLKEYQFVYNSLANELFLADKNGTAAIASNGTGFIAPDVTSYWSVADASTTYTPNGYWINAQQGSSSNPALDAPDGEVVEKGGAGEGLRSTYITAASGTSSSSGRKMFTFGTSSCSTYNARIDNNASCGFDDSHISCSSNYADFGYASSAACTSAAELANIVNWMRGYNNNGETVPPAVSGTTITARPTIHADVLHSRPVLVQYGIDDAANSDLVAFYGSNDGLLHAVQAGQGSTGGQELWSFVAKEFFSYLKRERDNSPQLQIPSPSSGGSTTVDSALKTKDYFFDGEVSTYIKRNSDNSINKVYLYVSMRRGGPFIYAFDVTNKSQPKVLWKISSTAVNDVSSSTFSHLAYTFSRPVVVEKTHANSGNPVVVFGGGYYGGYDTTTLLAVGEDANNACPTSGVTLKYTLGCGDRVYVVDAAAGTLVREFGAAAQVGSAMSYGVAGAVVALDSDGDGYTDRLYAADVGGNIWRMDINDASSSNWKLYQLASAATDGTNRRKFFFAPAVTVLSGYTAVMAGTGDREKPLKTTGTDRFYLFKDKSNCLDASSSSGGCTALTTISGDTYLADSSTLSSTDLATALATSTNRGWFYTFATSEKVINAPLSLGGVAYFSTNTPTANNSTSCNGSLGTAKGYQFSFLTGSLSSSVTFDSGGLPPSPITGLVSLTDQGTGQTVLVQVVVGAGGGDTSGVHSASGGGLHSALEGADKNVTPPSTKAKNYWYNKYDQSAQ